jgi:hypothetical protein
MNKVLFITVATGKYYDTFIPQLYKSMVDNVKLNFNLLCLTDSKTSFVKNVIHKPMPFLPFPFSTLMRYYYILENKKIISKYDYVFYIDSDMKIVNTIENEILAENVSVLHPGFYGKNQKKFPYETNQKSLACVEKDQGKKYYQGCFQGGSTFNFIKMVETLSTNIIKDLNKNIIAEWHDESHMNKYFIDNPPALELMPDYAMPEEWVGIKKEKIITSDKVHTPVFDDSGNFIRDDYDYVENISYNINYESTLPKIIHLLKNHDKIRDIK